MLIVAPRGTMKLTFSFGSFDWLIKHLEVIGIVAIDELVENALINAGAMFEKWSLIFMPKIFNTRGKIIKL